MVATAFFSARQLAVWAPTIATPTGPVILMCPFAVSSTVPPAEVTARASFLACLVWYLGLGPSFLRPMLLMPLGCGRLGTVRWVGNPGSGTAPCWITPANASAKSGPSGA